MPDVTKPLKDYTKALSASLIRGDSTEHTHRPALKSLIESLWPDAIATNEPRRISAGAPDYIISIKNANIGYIEAKDIGKSLKELEKSEQLKRYLSALPNLLLTDYVEFRWYTDGKWRQTATLGMVKDGAVKTTTESLNQVHDLLTNFMQFRVPAVGTPKELAARMARIARMIHDITAETFKQEGEAGTLHSMYDAFKEVLLHQLTPDEFADMFAQTVAYGLFAARDSKKPGEEFTRQSAAYLVPKTNPFLRKLFSHIAFDLDDRIVWLVDDLVQLLSAWEIDEVLSEFKKRTRQEDPVIHFYETFLAEYNPRMREVRGVYYTPEPVVSYIVRSVDHLLKTKFGKKDGLADPDVMILDPACGTGTFLFQVVKLIHKRMEENGQLGGWNDYVEKHLLPRLFGFELLMTPYTIAHLKMGMLLEELGYVPQSDQRLNIYLTNTLEEAETQSQVLGFAGFITEEANAASEVKREKPIMVVLGNPPYSGHSANKGPWIDGLLKGKLPDGTKVSSYYELDGQPLGEKNPKLLQDDYVKFIRFGQWRIEQTGFGILAYVSNNGYVSNPTFRGMRGSLMNTFTDIHVLNLHGSSRKRELSPSGKADENVFDIQQGVGIGLFVKELDKSNDCCIYYQDIWGSRDLEKYPVLSSKDVFSTDWMEIFPRTPHYLFSPLDEFLECEYTQGFLSADIFPISSTGVKTHRDHIVFDVEKKSLIDRISVFRDTSKSDDEIRGQYFRKQSTEDSRSGDTHDWKLDEARKILREDNKWLNRIIKCLYRPFDFQFLYYVPWMIDRPRQEAMQHMLNNNLGLITARSNKSQSMDHFFCSQHVVEAKTGESTTQSCLFPLYVYPTPEDEKKQKDLFADEHIWPLSDKGRRPNLNPEFVAEFEKKLGLKFITDGKGDMSATFGPEDIFDYIYAVFHSPTYRTRYAEFLKIDFPRVPITSDKDLFRRLAEKGAELVSLHLMESHVLNNLITKYPVSGSDVVEKVRFVDDGEDGETGHLTPGPSPQSGEGSLKTGRVYINGDQYFEGIAPEVWEFHIGGYQVLDKWLKDRKGRKLTWEDQQHYQKVVVTLKETMRLMQEIDEIIPSWPIE